MGEACEDGLLFAEVLISVAGKSWISIAGEALISPAGEGLISPAGEGLISITGETSSDYFVLAGSSMLPLGGVQRNNRFTLYALANIRHSCGLLGSCGHEQHSPCVGNDRT